MTVTDRTAATEQEFRDRIAAFETALTPPEVREAAERLVIDHDASFCCGAGEGFVQVAYDLIVDHPMWIDGEGRGLDYSPEREARIGDFLDALLPLVRAYGDGRAAAAVAAYRATQDGGAEEAQSGFRKRPVDLTPAGPGQDACAERFGRYGVCDLPKGHPPIAEAMGWLHSQDIAP